MGHPSLTPALTYRRNLLGSDFAPRQRTKPGSGTQRVQNWPKHREDLAGAQAKLAVLEGSAQDAPVTVSQKAFNRAKKAGYAGMAAIVCNSAAGVLPVMFPG